MSHQSVRCERVAQIRDRLFAAYEDNLDQIRSWISERREELADSTETIPAPLPAYADVRSPDFRYENFAMVGVMDNVPAGIAPEVERERRRYVAERTEPDGVIAQRLAGDR